MHELNFFSDYLEKKYGDKLYRIPVDLMLGCPNRENNFGSGCIFCAENGSRARHLSRDLKLSEQVKKGVEFVQARYAAKPPYIAYFQSFTNTYAPAGKLRELYSKVIEAAEFKVVIVATRPDALPEDVLDFLEELAQKYELWVELGVQSAKESTLKLINRGHTFAQTAEAVKKLAERNINTAAHLIVGLPGETEEDFLNTARAVAALPFKAVKFHQLMVIKNTVLARKFAENPEFVKLLNEYSYASILTKMIRLLPESTLIMRLAADAGHGELIAPKWWMNKSRFLEFFRKEFHSPSLFPTQRTEDGTFTLYHPQYKQHFHSLAGAGREAELKFADASNLQQKIEIQEKIDILDVGFGLGMNTFATLKAGGEKVRITALERDIRVLEAALALYPSNSEQYRIINTLLKNKTDNNGQITLIIADARQSMKKMAKTRTYDFIWLDAFSPDVNPELWSFDFLKLLFAHLKPDGQLLTYSCNHSVRGALLRAGAFIGETPAFGRKTGGTVAAKRINLINKPLTDKELNIILKSTAGIAMRDVQLEDSAENILARHKKLVAKLRARGIPKWYKQP